MQTDCTRPPRHYPWSVLYVLYIYIYIQYVRLSLSGIKRDYNGNIYLNNIDNSMLLHLLNGGLYLVVAMTLDQDYLNIQMTHF